MIAHWLTKVPGKTVTPSPGFSLKSKSLNDDKKIFINICQHEDIEVPGVKKRLNEAGEEIEGMNIPMSVGAPREELDKASVSCRVYDIIVNPVVLTESESMHCIYVCVYVCLHVCMNILYSD